MQNAAIATLVLSSLHLLTGCISMANPSSLPDEILIVHVNGPEAWRKQHDVALSYQGKRYPLPAIILRDEDARTFYPGMPRFLIVDDHALMFEVDDDIGKLYPISHSGSGFAPEVFGPFTLTHIWRIAVAPTPDAEYVPYLDRELFNAAQNTGSLIDLRSKKASNQGLLTVFNLLVFSVISIVLVFSPSCKCTVMAL